MVPVVQVLERVVQVGKVTPQLFDNPIVNGVPQERICDGSSQVFQVNPEVCIERLRNC